MSKLEVVKVESAKIIDPGRSKAVVEVRGKLTGAVKAPRIITVTFNRHDVLTHGYQFLPETGYLHPHQIPVAVVEAATKLFKETHRD